MKNNKGFTLIELLTVIIILMGISFVAVAGISSSLSKRDTRECEEQKELAKNAAKIYFALNPDKKPDNGVKISTLISKGYFNESSKTNRLKGSVKVKIIDNNYVYDGNCV